MTELKDRNILIVDDQPNNLRVLFASLQAHDMNVFLADNGPRALEQIERLQPDIILMDVMMPGMDGFECCKQIKAEERFEAIPIIFMTALTETSDKLSAFAAGGVDYISKPFQQEEVLARIRIHLTISTLRRELTEKNRHLEKMLQEVKTLQGILPICSKCKMVRDDKGYWKQVEQYISEHSDVEFSHSYCPGCLKIAMDEIDTLLAE